MHYIRFWGKMTASFEFKHRGRLGPEELDDKTMRILNRIVTLGDNGIEYERGQRHVEIAAEMYWLKAGSTPVLLPGSKDKPGVGDEVPVDATEGGKY